MMASPPPDHHHHHHQPKMLKPSTTTAATTSSSAAAAARPPEHGLKCPRCDSSNTKFCYYNNYSLSQPRHFCKTCRRYWTKGGALRNVPVGGGCRKSKKSSSKSMAGPASYSSSSPSSAVLVAANSNFSNGGFQLGMVPFSGGNQFIGFNYPIAEEHQMLGFGVNQGQSSAIASSIESLSSINQDLHWKLQQQRLAMLFGAAEHKTAAATETAMIEGNHDHHHHHHHHHDPRHEPIMPISFQGAEKADVCGARSHEAAAGAGASATGWFLESNGRINGNSSSNNNSSASEWNGITAWSDMPQFSALP